MANEIALSLLDHDCIVRALQDSITDILGKDTHPTSLNLNMKNRKNFVVSLVARVVHDAITRLVITEGAVFVIGTHPIQSQLLLCLDLL